MSELVAALLLVGVLLRASMIVLAVVAAIYTRDTKRRSAALEVLRILRAQDKRTTARLRRRGRVEPQEVGDQRGPAQL